MRITIIDIDDTATAMSAIVTALGRNGKIVHEPKSSPPPPLEIEASPVSTPSLLSPQLADAWRYLVAHDVADGLSTSEVAEGLQIEVPTAGYRLSRLIDKGLVHKVRRARYRAGEA